MVWALRGSKYSPWRMGDDPLCDLSSNDQFLTARAENASPTSSEVTTEPSFKNETNSYDPNLEAAEVEVDELNIVCPPHTTEKKLMTKIDFHVVPFLCILYLLAFLDRVNIANARSFGLSTDLKLTGNEYNVALTIFFVPYIFFEIPSNILLKKLSPRVWLSGCMFMFGLVGICQGLVKSYGGLLATRFFLGIFEAGMFPGCFYLIVSFCPSSRSSSF
jgi:hypothetical protein